MERPSKKTRISASLESGLDHNSFQDFHQDFHLIPGITEPFSYGLHSAFNLDHEFSSVESSANAALSSSRSSSPFGYQVDPTLHDKDDFLLEQLATTVAETGPSHERKATGGESLPFSSSTHGESSSSFDGSQDSSSALVPLQPTGMLQPTSNVSFSVDAPETKLLSNYYPYG